MSAPRFFGISHGGHDAGFACFNEEGDLLALWQHERMSRQKRIADVGAIDENLRRCGLEPLNRNDYFFTCFSRHISEVFLKKSVQERTPQSGVTNPMMTSVTDAFAGYRIYQVDHHQAHAAAAWLYRDEDVTGDSLYIAMDGGGHKYDMRWECYSAGVISETRLEEFPTYVDRKRYSSFERLCEIKLGPTNSMEVAGKLMGMAGYVPQSELRRIDYQSIQFGNFNKRILSEGLTPKIMAELGSIYQTYVDDVKGLVADILDANPAYGSVVVGGGTFLALDLNTFIVQERRKKLAFTPGVDDSGISLGSAALGFFLVTGRWPKRLRSPYLQWCPPEKRDLYRTPSEAATMLKNNGVIGLIAGSAELGPRALGNRSFLTRPTRANAKLISEEIKRREFYRPVAPIVTDREFDRFFGGPRGRYMQFRNECKPLASELIPGIVHADGSARCQVLAYADHPWLYDLLVECGKLYGAEVLINTSLNAPGKPICNTLTDAKKEIVDPRVQFVAF